MILTLTLAVALASTPPSKPSLRTCFETGGQTSWTAIDDHTVLVRDGAAAFRVTTATCPALRDPLPQFTTVLPGGGLICHPHDAHLYVGHDSLIPVPCEMTAIDPITREEADALLHPRAR